MFNRKSLNFKSIKIVQFIKSKKLINLKKIRNINLFKLVTTVFCIIISLTFILFINHSIKQNKSNLIQMNEMREEIQTLQILTQNQDEILKIKEQKIVEKEQEIIDKMQVITNNKQQIQDKENEIQSQQKEIDELKKKLTSKIQRDSEVKKHEISRGSTSLNSKYLGSFKISHYTAYDSGCTGITASGTPAIAGRTVAVDPNVIPLGTKLYIEGYGEVIAEDTGGAIKGNIIDVCVATQSIARKNGIKNLKVWILQ